MSTLAGLRLGGEPLAVGLLKLVALLGLEAVRLVRLAPHFDHDGAHGNWAASSADCRQRTPSSVRRRCLYPRSEDTADTMLSASSVRWSSRSVMRAPAPRKMA